MEDTAKPATGEASPKGGRPWVELQGIHWPRLVTEDALNAIKHFDVRDDDVWIATYPKAGTHWVAEICHLILNDGDVDKIDRQQQPMPLEIEGAPTDDELAKFGMTDRLPRYKEAPGWKSPRVLVTHVPRSFLPEQILTKKKGKMITVFRNPKDTVVSEYFFFKCMSSELAKRTFEESLQATVYSDTIQYTSWFDHVLEYWADRHNEQTLTLKYEDIKRDTRGAVIQIADHLGRPLSDEVIDKITNLVTVAKMKTRYHVAGEKRAFDDNGKALKTGAPNLVRKGIVGDWKSMFTVAENERFDELYQQKMMGTGLKFEFE